MAQGENHPVDVAWPPAGVFATVVGHLRHHLRLPPAEADCLVSPHELLQLLSDAVAGNAALAARALASLARLLQSLPALEMPSSVGAQVPLHVSAPIDSRNSCLPNVDSTRLSTFSKRNINER